MSAATNKRAIGMAMSGGGVRAVAFHAGALQYVAEAGRMSEVVHISSVSGGSLFTGLVLHFAGFQWPSDDQYLNEVLPNIRRLLTRTSLQNSALRRLLFVPENWRYAFSRAIVLAQSLELEWGVKKSLRELPSLPVWSINGSCSESGRRFRFKSGEMGDYETGYASVPDFELADALAMSAAFPGGIGPLAIKTADYAWHKKANWGDQLAASHKPQFETLHLYDGGVYDNLGIEPLFDIGKQAFREPEDRPDRAPDIDYIFVSDAGRAYDRVTPPRPLDPRRFRRLADLAFDQVRALRVRCLMNFLNEYPERGALLPIGLPAPPNSKAPVGDFMEIRQIRAAARLPTHLKRLTANEFDMVSRHGYECGFWAAANLRSV